MAGAFATDATVSRRPGQAKKENRKSIKKRTVTRLFGTCHIYIHNFRMEFCMLSFFFGSRSWFWEVSNIFHPVLLGGAETASESWFDYGNGVKD